MPTYNNYFVSSGIFAVGIYLFFVIGTLYYILDPDITKISSFNKNTAIELDLTLLEEKKDIKQTQFEKKTVKEEIPQEEKSASRETVTKKVDTRSLFANVSTVAPVVKETVTNQKSVEVSSTRKATFEKEERAQVSKNISKTLENVNLNPTSSLSPPSDANVDEYYSLIYDILASRWNPASLKDNLFADVIITIYKNGKFNYSIISKSGDSNFDASLERFLNSQLNQKFPEHTKGDKTTLKVTFKTKGE